MRACDADRLVLIARVGARRLAVMGAAARRPPLVDAARNADRDALRALLQKKADVNAAEATARPRCTGRATGTMSRAPTC